ncbi:MAG TPA: arylsulfatase [Tepidisphaeraceae bacterium]|nr:arylsulfatase [Tepidisphaeraceae bacterium]
MKWMKFMAVCLVVAGFGGVVEGAGARRPNIVVMLADDMGYSDVGCYGGEIETPNIDALAAGGVRMSEFYNCSRCCPTRASLLTGVYPHQAGVGHMTWEDLHLPGYRADLSKDTPTIAEVLKGAGYATFMSGKWHVTINDQPGSPKDNWPRQRGFDRYYGIIKGSGSYYDPAMLVRENTPIQPRGDKEYQPEHYYFTDAIADQAIRFVKEHDAEKKEQPFFLYVAFTSPHWPLQAPEDVIGKYKGKYDGGFAPVREARYERMKQMGIIDPKWELTPAPQLWSDVKHVAWEARCMEVYAAQVDRMDQNVGKIVAALKEEGELENTLIIFMSDNGACAETTGRADMPKRDKEKPVAPRAIDKPQTQSNGAYTLDGTPVRSGPEVIPGDADSFIAYGRSWANVSNTPFREYKHYVHEGGIAAPFIAYWPGGVSEHGTWNKSPAHVIDIMATCVALSGAKFEGKVAMQGVDLEPVFGGKDLERGKPIFWEHEGNRAMRDGKWKLVATGPKTPWELYDMDADRTEMHDLAGKELGRVKEMGDAWEKWAEETNVLPLLPKGKKKLMAAE